jgi:type IV secretory pathway VirB2 component (pilin)
MKDMFVHFFQRAAPLAMLLVLTTTLAFAQTSSFGTATQGIANEMIAIAKWVGIILCIICGIGLMVGGPGTIAKVSGLLLGLVFALFASPIIGWVQGRGNMTRPAPKALNKPLLIVASTDGWQAWPFCLR